MTTAMATAAPNSNPLDVGFLTIDEAAEFLRVNRRTLDNMRWNETGPEFRRHGGRIVYDRAALLAWSETQRAKRAQVRKR